MMRLLPSRSHLMSTSSWILPILLVTIGAACRLIYLPTAFAFAHPLLPAACRRKRIPNTPATCARQICPSDDPPLLQRLQIPLHKSSVVAFASSQDANDLSSASISNKLTPPRTLSLATWLLSISAFIIINLKVRPYPESILYALSRSQWSLLHALCSMLFGGTIIVSTLIEHLVVTSRKASVIKFWFLTVPRLDSKVVLPALTGGMLSGVGQATIDYGGLATAPKYVVGAVHALLTFGLWWGATDLTTQRKAEEVVRSMNGEDGEKISKVPKVLRTRRWSNIVSCLFVAGLYALMVLKPWS